MGREFVQWLTRGARWLNPRRWGPSHRIGAARRAKAVWHALRTMTAVETERHARKALAQGRLDDAARAAHRGLIYNPDHRPLRQTAARIALQRQRPCDVDALLGTDPQNPQSRLLLLVAMLQSGQRDAARLQLHTWTAQPDAPAEAYALLAALELDDQRPDAARQVLSRAEQLIDPPHILPQLRLLADVADNRTHSPRRTAATLAHRFRADSFVGGFLRSLGLDQPADHLHTSMEVVDQLAGQLLRRPYVIPSLVEAQRLQPQHQRINLLRDALGRIVDDLPDTTVATESLAHLAHLAGDVDDARRWARRALQLKPYSAAMALLLDRIDNTPGVPADTQPHLTDCALRDAHEAKPDWPDVRRAMILRCQSRGKADLARHYADQWIAQHPDHPLARQTASEVAA